MSEQTPEIGRAFCSHCGWFHDYEVGGEAQRSAAIALAYHASTCPQNPLVAELAALRADLSRVQGENAVMREALDDSVLKAQLEMARAVTRDREHERDEARSALARVQGERDKLRMAAEDAALALLKLSPDDEISAAAYMGLRDALASLTPDPPQEPR